MALLDRFGMYDPGLGPPALPEITEGSPEGAEFGCANSVFFDAENGIFYAKPHGSECSDTGWVPIVQGIE